MEITLFGIANCDTIRKAKKWLDANQMTYQYHDYRKQGLSEQQLRVFTQALGWEQVLNKRGTTFRQLDEALKSDLNEEKAIALMLDAPAMIKRPILQTGNAYHLGFKAEQYQALFAQG